MISVSFMKSELSPQNTINKIEKTDANFIHVDIMDGKFVKNKNYTPKEIIKLLGNTTKPLDIHLMVNDPIKWIDALVTLNIAYITFHYEIKKDIISIINYVKDLGIKVGIAIKPETSIDKIKELLPIVELILVMGVEPGMGGQEFISSQIDKINELKLIQPQYNFLIGVDGGINEENISLIKADIITVGSFITMHDNYQEQLNKLK